MKHVHHFLFAASLFGNAILGWHLFTASHTPASAPSLAQHHSPTVALDWHSLEAPDFTAYIANLRRAGCPEATIRHLIEPELHAVFEARRQNPAAHAGEPSSTADEAVTLAALLDVPQVLEHAQATAVAAKSPDITSSPPIPAAFLVGNASSSDGLQNDGLSVTPTDTTLAPDTLQTLADMRRQFGDQVTSSGSDPSSREYFRQWLKAQRRSDDYFASLYGGDYFITVQQQANLQRSQSGPSNAAQVTKSSN